MKKYNKIMDETQYLEEVMGILSGWKEVANYLGCHKLTAMRYAKDESLPVKKVGGRILISRRMIEKWLEER